MSIIVTRSGAHLDLANPSPGSIVRGDIAAGLSGACRFAAQTEVFYSVAQHAVLVADLVEVFLREEGDLSAPRTAGLIAALHHDSHEAFMSDIPAPLKKILPEYDRIANGLDRVIFEAIGLGPGVRDGKFGDLIDRADMVARCIEAEEIIPASADLVLANAGQVAEHDLSLGRDLWRNPLVPAEARTLFVEREDLYHDALVEEADRVGESVEPAQLARNLNVSSIPLPWFALAA